MHEQHPMRVRLPASQGGLPTFLDIGESFSASALAEDNLLAQLASAGKRLVRRLAAAHRVTASLRLHRAGRLRTRSRTHALHRSPGQAAEITRAHYEPTCAPGFAP